jgi:hypothetical protein
MFNSFNDYGSALMSEVSGLSAGRIIGVTHTTIRRHILADRLKARRQGLDKTWWIDVDELRKFAQQYNYRFNEQLAQELARN